jgi:hypothetical protein
VKGGHNKGTGKKARVRAAVLSGYCNTTLDVADETGLAVEECSSYVAALRREGLVRWTDRRLPNKSPIGAGRKLYVFEVVA